MTTEAWRAGFYRDGTPRYRMRLPAITCPHCGKVQESVFYHSKNPRLPEDGELLVHRDCGQWSIVVADGVRKATEEEITAWVDAEPQRRRL